MTPEPFHFGRIVDELLERSDRALEPSRRTNVEIHDRDLHELEQAVQELKKLRDDYPQLPMFVNLMSGASRILNETKQCARGSQAQAARDQARNRWWFLLSGTILFCAIGVVASRSALEFLRGPINGAQAIGFCVLVGSWAVLAIVALRMLRLGSEYR